MFDIGFTELLIVGIVALIVLGPERLPRAARMLGLALRRARAQWHSVKAELERELAADELRRSLQEAREAGNDLRRELRDTADDALRDIDPGLDADDAQVSTARTHRDAGTGAEARPADNAAPPAPRDERP